MQVSSINKCFLLNSETKKLANAKTAKLQRTLFRKNDVTEPKVLLLLITS